MSTIPSNFISQYMDYAGKKTGGLPVAAPQSTSVFQNQNQSTTDPMMDLCKQMNDKVSQLISQIGSAPMGNAATGSAPANSNQVQGTTQTNPFAKAGAVSENYSSTPVEGLKDIQAGNYGGVQLSGPQINTVKGIAKGILEEAKANNLSPEKTRKALVIALSTAMQESTMAPITYGDEAGPDSCGAFQQRDSWGTREERLNPESSARLFAKELFKTDFMNKSVTGAAYGVQRCAADLKNEYAKHQPMAEAVVSALIA